MLSCYFILTALYFGGGSEYIYNQIVHPFVFSLRNRFGLFPQLDPRIKIYAVDHKTMADIGVETIPVEEWTLLFKALAKSRPQAIFIDKTFPLPISRDLQAMKELSAQIAMTRPISVGAFFVSNPIKGFSDIKTSPINLDTSTLPWLKETPGFFYGPEPQLLKAFSHIGHTNYEGFGYIKPLIMTNEHQVMPFWSFNLPGVLSTRDGVLQFNSHPIPVNSKGQILVNLAPAEEYWKRTHSLVTSLQKARKGLALDEITSNDIVLILADMVQGATAFKVTPSGTMPGGFIMAEVVNSVLGGTWLKSVGGELILTLVFCFLGMILAVTLSPLYFVGSLLFWELFLIGHGGVGFCFYNLLLPWAFPAIGLFSTSLIIYSERVRASELRSRHLRFSLEGIIGPDKLKSLLNKKIASWLEPRSQVLTVMFIDIVGFSMTAEEEKPEVVFRQLRSLLGEISDIVHEFGGLVDKSLGDGLLCYFGYQYDEHMTSDHLHARQALDCAIQIQKAAVQRNLSSPMTTPFFPLRIGINTGDVYIGDLGGTRRIDFTVIGHSVNYAQRLESACEIYRVMIGAATWDLLDLSTEIDKSYTKKKIPIKYHEELGEAYEHNPLQDNPQTLNEAMSRFRDAAGLKRNEERFPVDPSFDYKFKTNHGIGAILDFSLSGISIQMDHYFGKGIIMSFTFSSADGKLQMLCETNGITAVTGVVKWGHPNKGSYRHGILFANLSADQKEKLLSSFRAGQKISTKVSYK